MKLYTENDLIIAIGLTRHGNPEWSTAEIINDLTPIEIPSDEELKKQFDVDEFDPYDLAYLGGAIRMRNLIQGGNNEQQ